jgi:hypothetical protein
VTADNDGLTSFGSETRRLHRAASLAHPNRILVVSGADHGVDLLTGSHAPRA